jgi:urea transport system permease protein
MHKIPVLLALGLMLVFSPFAHAQTLPEVMAQNADAIAKPSRQTIAPVIAAITATGDPAAAVVLAAWAEKGLGLRQDGQFFLIVDQGDSWALTDLSGAAAGTAAKGDITQLKPNSGVRGLIAGALVQFQLSDPDPARRIAALTAITRAPEKGHLAALRAAIKGEGDADILSQKQRLERLLTLQFDPDPAARIAAIDGFGSDIGLDLRAALNPLLASTRQAFATVPAGANIAQILTVGADLSAAEAYDLLVAASLAPARLLAEDARKSLESHIENGKVGGIAVADLGSQAARDAAYSALEAAGIVPAAATEAEVQAALSANIFADVYTEPNPQITSAAKAALGRIETRLAGMQALDLTLDGLSLASIYFLAAIGLAITFGVMRVINMAHGEFITMGAYTGYVVQLFVPNYTLSLIVALPLAFAITFGAGVLLERLVIRHLAKRPLETLLATFGISIALQQLFKNIFGTQARPLTSPAWLDGAFVMNDVVSISYIRIAIFGMALIFLGLFLLMMKRTALGLHVRAVTQNPAMAASMGINTARINMLTFGLGSGIAGVAGVAIGLFAKVTSELGSDYIVQSFMTVVVGGVGNIWGTLAGAGLIGFLQKGIEWFNPSNTLAAQTYMILFIILFIQIRPRGIIALKGRAAGD